MCEIEMKSNQIQRPKRVNATIHIELGGSHPIDRTQGEDLLEAYMETLTDEGRCVYSN
ncbi:MAG: hypothetical protein Hyperionvirus26_33 [Hyperionvirus sp.]|uniref:Uncharacterized protein n=1 Tax=Hyperionvirus sp. TaxID=2487770 RepID=A0A3G5AB59_9VIRU|nr:MAG: hypothetical protein Hyperionvirus26_33 [Hyperionvirus sp.]